MTLTISLNLTLISLVDLRVFWQPGSLVFSALEIFLVMRYINLLFTYLLTYYCSSVLLLLIV